MKETNETRAELVCIKINKRKYLKKCFQGYVDVEALLNLKFETETFVYCKKISV